METSDCAPCSSDSSGVHDGYVFYTSVGVRQGCLLSRTLFNIMTHAPESYNGTISSGGFKITNLRFADGNDGIIGEEDELTKFVQNLDTAATKFGMKIIFYHS